MVKIKKKFMKNLDKMQEKSEQLEFLKKRELDRKLEFESKRNHQESLFAENEKVDYFQQDFNNKKLEILNLINISSNVGTSKLPEHLDKIFKSILALQKYVAASNIFLRTYDIKVYQGNIQDLTALAKDLELKLIPKKKFGFKNKKIEKPKGSSLNVINDIKNKVKIEFDDNYCGFKNKKGERLLLKSTEIIKKDVSLTNLDDCIINIFGTPSTLHVSNLNNCTILCGPVSTSIFADACVNCKFVISCQQLRLHSSHDVEIYLHVTSRAIMEDCEKISVAPYNLTYENIDYDYLESGLDKNINNWECVDDFNWLNVEVKSPNWNILDAEERVTNWSHAFVSQL